MKTFFIILFTFLITIGICYQILVPLTVEKRAHALDLLQYNGSKDRFECKDSIVISKGDLYYLEHGNFNGY